MAELRKLGQLGAEAGKDVAQGAKGAQESHDSLAGALRRVNIESQALAMGRQVLDSLAAGAVAAQAELKRMADEFINLRDRGRELAGVLNQKGDAAFTIAQAQFGAETGFADPNKAADFRTGFQGEANQYAGRFASPDEFAQFEKEAAKLGNKSGVAPEAMAKLAGMVVRTGALKGQTSAEAMKRLGGSFGTMMSGGGSISELAGQLSRMSGLVGKDKAFGTIEEAAVATRMAAETNLPEAYTKQTEMRRGVLELSLDEKTQDQAKALGIDEHTGNLDAVRKLYAGQQKSGKGVDAFLKGLFPMSGVRDAFRDAMAAHEGGLLDQGLEDAGKVKKGDTEADSAAFFADPTRAGKLAVERGRTAKMRIEEGQEQASIEHVLEHARGDLTKLSTNPAYRAMQGLMDLGPIKFLRGVKGQGYEGGQQAEYARATGIAREEARAAGLGEDQIGPVPNVATMPQRELTHYIAQLVALTKETLELKKKAGERPLAAPAPKVGERR